MPPKFARLAGYGAFAAGLAIAALFVLLVLGTRPSATSGLDGTQRFLTWFTIAGVLLALVGVHLLIGRRLLLLSRGERREL
jgi:hypothetical protein